MQALQMLIYRKVRSSVKLRQQEHAASLVEYANKDKKSTAFAEHLFNRAFQAVGINRDH